MTKSKLVVCFTGLAHKVCGFTEERITDLVESNDVDILWLEDTNHYYYLRGINGEIDSIGRLTDHLESIMTGYNSIRFVGGSGGSFGALLYGTLLDIETICFSGYYDISLNQDVFLHYLLTVSSSRREAWKKLYHPDVYETIHWYLDLRKLRNTKRPTNHAVLVYPTFSVFDSLFNRHMQNAYNVTVKATATHKHCSCAQETYKKGLLRDFLIADIEEVKNINLMTD